MKDKVIVVTGASRGIGKGIALGLGGRGISIHCDHRVDAQVEAAFARVFQEQGRIDVLINNALGSPDQRVMWGGQKFWEIPLSLWDDLIDVGLRSHLVAARCVVPAMIAAGDWMARSGQALLVEDLAKEFGIDGGRAC